MYRLVAAALGAALAAPAAAFDGGFHSLHNPTAHMYIARKAFELYSTRYQGGELGKYIGDYSGDAPSKDDNGSVVEGTYDEDKGLENPFNEQIPQLRHFWDPKGGPHRGLWSNDSGVNRAQKYVSGGFGLDGKYDGEWSENQSPFAGRKGEGALALFKTDKPKAYWYLGHIAHLLQDLSIPAHVHLFPHPFNGDSYEHFMKKRHRDWAALPSGGFSAPGSLYELFLVTAEQTNDYDAGSGDNAGVDGELDKGRRRQGGFSDAELREMGDALMPLAVRGNASLYLWFYKQVDQDPPLVELEAPRFEGRQVRLRARAADEISGVDRLSLRVEWREKGSAHWRPAGAGAEAALAPPPGRYALRALAADAAGNLGVSPERELVVEPESLELAGLP